MVVRVLDLFSGSGSIAKALSCWPCAFEVTQLELDPEYALQAIMDRPDALEQHIVADALRWDPAAAGCFDIVWASPPCRTYSCLQYRWRDKHARELLMQTEGDPLVQRALEVIAELDPAVWFVENPMGGALSKRPFMQSLDFVDVSYCHFGSAKKPWPYRKNTRIWTNLSEWKTARTCRNDCPAFAQGRHASNVTWVRRAVRGQVPPALIRSIFSAACVQLDAMKKQAPSSSKNTQAQLISSSLKETLIAHGLDPELACVAMQAVQEIQPPQKTPKRTDLLIKIGNKRHRSISAAAGTLREMFAADEEPEPADEPSDPEPEQPPEDLQAPVAAEINDVLKSTDAPVPEKASDSKEIHYHFHITVPSAGAAPSVGYGNRSGGYENGSGYGEGY